MDHLGSDHGARTESGSRVQPCVFQCKYTKFGLLISCVLGLDPLDNLNHGSVREQHRNSEAHLLRLWCTITRAGIQS